MKNRIIFDRMGMPIEGTDLNHRFNATIKSVTHGNVFIEIEIMRIHQHLPIEVKRNFNIGDLVFYPTFFYREEYKSRHIDPKFVYLVDSNHRLATKENILKFINNQLDTNYIDFTIE